MYVQSSWRKAVRCPLSVRLKSMTRSRSIDFLWEKKCIESTHTRTKGRGSNLRLGLSICENALFHVSTVSLTSASMFFKYLSRSK